MFFKTCNIDRTGADLKASSKIRKTSPKTSMAHPIL